MVARRAFLIIFSKNKSNPEPSFFVTPLAFPRTYNRFKSRIITESHIEISFANIASFCGANVVVDKPRS